MTFLDRYNARIEQVGTRLCIGLDSDSAWIPDTLSGETNPQLAFNRQIIGATHRSAAAYKPNLGFYESRGRAGYDALEQTLELIPDDVLTVGDAKRGDIGNTARHYARSLAEVWGFDAVTVNPYMGTDTIEPYFEHGPRCVFVLALTSNPGSQEFQRQKIGNRQLFEVVIETCLERFSDADKLGFVVGATHPEELATIRSMVGPDTPLLIPGIGAQGGDIDATVTANNGGVALINVSRGVIKASTESDFAEAAGNAAERYRELLGAKDPGLHVGQGSVE